MTEKQLPLIEAEELERCIRPPVPRPDIFIVVAYNLTRSCWSVRPEWFMNVDLARKSASYLSQVWDHVRIVKIPGEENDAEATRDT